MSDLYDTDVVAWSERQADLLRRVAAGERINDQVDWPNVIEEVESVGQSQVDAVESLWTQAFLHDLKAEAWPIALDVDKWRADARLFRRQARRKYRASMRQKINLSELYADALAGLPDRMDGAAPLPVPQACPVTLDELLAEPMA
jgi:hypothetical protein